MEWQEQREDGIDIDEELRQTNKILFETLERAFKEKDYETAGQALYQLQYLQKMVK